MPNHVTNRITVKGATIQDILNITTGAPYEDGEIRAFDFNKLVPMPEELSNTVSGSLSGDEQIELLKKQAMNEEKYGYPTWYEFALENWGTKWNAYDVIVDEDFIQFDTAWATPEPIIAKLSEMLPRATITVAFADEDIGYNCGIYTYCNGKLIESSDMSVMAINEGTALSFACQIKYDNPDEWKTW